MLSTLAAMAMLPAQTWFGPVTVTFKVQFTDNPYDPSKNDVRVRFVPAKGDPIERLAYFDEEAGSWKATLVSTVAGDYKATLIRNGKPQGAAANPAKIVLDKAMPRGFLRRSKLYPRRFQWDDGTYYLPFGINLGWQGGDGMTVPDYLKKFGEHGLNWTRIWACHWDGKNLWWPADKTVKVEPRQLYGDAIQKWDAIAAAAETAGVGWQWTLFHHGPWSSRVNSNWGENPWNVANGGWLKTPTEFFTDSEARERAKLYLRYVVARYAHNPNLISWELFNEVEWVDPRYDGKWDLVREWHKEMAAYLRSLDPYGRLVTTSSTREEPGLYEHMDYLQPHLYAPEPGKAMAAAEMDGDKPGFFGEFGTEGQTTPEVERLAIRDGVLWTLLAGQSGPAAYWYWDRVEREKLWPEFKRLGDVLKSAKVAERPDSYPLSLTATTKTLGTLRLTAAIGWGKSLKNQFRLPEDGLTGALPISGYVQSLDGENVALANNAPFTFTVRSASGGTFRVRTAQASRGGGTLILKGPSGESRKDFPAGAPDRPAVEVLSVAIPAGLSTVTLEGRGADWTRIAAIEVDGLAPAARVAGLGSQNWRFIRVVSTGSELEPVSISRHGLPTGTYQVLEVDLDDSKTETVHSLQVLEGQPIRWTPRGKDVALILDRKG